jgi:murein DD-endopeptidase MepM/ murein hydrolase activator NlpD
LPPFGTRWSYGTSTYAGHSDFAVDFNRGGPGADEGDWVMAPAPGIVAYLDVRAPRTEGPDDPGVSELLIDHAGGLRTLYSHMKSIPRIVRVGAPIKLRQRLGRISDVGTTTGSHLHHGHYRRIPRSEDGFGEPIKMRIQDVPMDASVGDSETGHEDGWVLEGQRVRGPVLRAVFRVRVWRQEDRSRWRELRFTVTKEGRGVPDCVDPGCPPAP